MSNAGIFHGTLGIGQIGFEPSLWDWSMPRSPSAPFNQTNSAPPCVAEIAIIVVVVVFYNALDCSQEC